VTVNDNWVDFRELRQRLRFNDVLKSYGVQLKIRGDRATGFCPLPGHPRHEGKRRTPSFSAHLSRGLFNCFGCQAKGNQIDFACYMSGVDPADPAAVRRVALDLQSRFLGNDAGRCDEASAARSTRQITIPEIAVERPGGESALPIVVNEPLQFTLKQLDAEHPYLKERGLTAQTIAHFGLGYCARGLMKGRIAIPLHDAANRLVGYAGRVVDDATIDEENPKYRFPSAREREGKVYEFRRALCSIIRGHSRPRFTTWSWSRGSCPSGGSGSAASRMSWPSWVHPVPTNKRG